MRNWLPNLRPNVLLICLMLLAVCLVDILADGQAEIGLVAAGALAAVAKEIIDSDTPPKA